MTVLSRLARAFLTSTITRVTGTGLGLLLLVHNIDLGAVAHRLGTADPRWAAIGVGLTALAVVSSVMEWGFLLRCSASFSWARVGSVYLQSIFFSQIVPAGVGGDAMRAVTIGRETGHGTVLASLAGSRMAGLLGMALWGMLGAILLRTVFGPVALVGAVLFASLMCASWVLALVAERVIRRVRVARRLELRGHLRGLRIFTRTFAHYARHPQRLLQSVVVGMTGWGINLFALHFFALAVGADVPWAVFAVAIPLTLVATLTPFSINGVGMREGVLVGLLAHVGVHPSNAAALSVIVDLQMVPFAVAGAMLWMRRRDLAIPCPERGRMITT